MDTLTDPRMTAWTRRRLELDRLGTLRVFRTSVCGCDRCGDQAKAAELDQHIADCLSRITVLGDICCIRPTHALT
jgi:hypothetical protein